MPASNLEFYFVASCDTMDFEKHQNLDTMTIKISACEFNVAANGDINFKTVPILTFRSLTSTIVDVPHRYP